MAKSSLIFRYSDSDKSPHNKTERRASEIHQRTNVALLDESIDDDVFTESNRFEEDEALVLSILILNIYKKVGLDHDNNSIFK